MVSKKDALAKVRDELFERKRDLEEKLSVLSREKFSDGQVQDPGDQAIESTMESVRSTLQSSEIEEYNRIVRALEKIEDGSYGICMDCEQEISEKRLKSFPNATRCLRCQEAFEDRGPGF